MSTLMARPKGKRKGKALHVWIKAELRDAIELCREKHRRNLNVEVELALEKYLAEEGFWPPPSSKSKPPKDSDS